MRAFTLTVTVLVVLACASAQAASPKAPEPKTFVLPAATRSLAGLELSQLALQRSESAAVRRLAQRIVDEQAATYESLLEVATLVGVDKPPDTIGLEQRGIKSRLATLTGVEFDRAYLEALQRNDARDIALYRSYAQHGGDETLKAWVAEHLPAIRRRQQLADAAALEINRAATR